MFYLPSIKEASAAVNMAVDAFFVDEGLTAPLLRIYRFQKTALTIGFAQQVSQTLRLEEIRKYNIDIARRVTGGKALLHDQGLTYSIIVPRKLLGDRVSDSYTLLSKPIFTALSRFRSDLSFSRDQAFKGSKNTVCFLEHEVETIVAEGAKIVGSAQKRNRWNILQHGEINVVPSNLPISEFFYTDLPASILQEACTQRIGALGNCAEEGLYQRLTMEIKREFEKLFGRSQEYYLTSTEQNSIMKQAQELHIDV